MAELADAADLKSAGAILVGSSPSPGTSERPPNLTLALLPEHSADRLLDVSHIVFEIFNIGVSL